MTIYDRAFFVEFQEDRAVIDRAYSCVEFFACLKGIERC
jgi:hypothetical protein